MTGSDAKQGAGAPVWVEVGLSVLVRDPEVLRAYARRRYAACWFDREWEPDNLAQAVLESLVISNENPSPADYGIEIVEAQAREESAHPRGAIADRPSPGRS